MYKYVYCHDSGEYDEYTSLKKSECKIFGTLRGCTSAGAFLYAPTTEGKAILFSFTQGNGQFRVDGYKGEYAEIGSNPAAYIGNVRVEKPYHELLLGALPGRTVFASGEVDSIHMANLAQYVIFGDTNKDIVLLGGNIVKQATDYLKYLFLLFPLEYVKRVGFCINKYLKYDLEDGNKFLSSDEKPIVRIYALDSQKEFADSYKVNLNVSEREPETSDLGVIALRCLINLGVTQENFNTICRATESAFSADGRVNRSEYTRCLVRAAYESSHSLTYAEALIGYGFVNNSEKSLFIDCINRCLTSGNETQKKLAASKAIEMLHDDIATVSDNLFSYIISQATITPAERNFLVQSAVAQLNDNTDDGDAAGVLGVYLNAAIPSWRQKYEFITEIIQRLFESSNRLAAHNVCKILSERFNNMNLAHARDITLSDLFVLRPEISIDAKEAIYAALLKNDCNAESIHRATRLYLKTNPTLGDILRVHRKVQDIFGVVSNDFIFGDNECVRIIQTRCAQIPLGKLLELYDSLTAQLSEYIELKAEFFAAILNLDKLKALEEPYMDEYRRFLSDAEGELSGMQSTLDENKARLLNDKFTSCKKFLFEKGNDRIAQQRIEKFSDDFVRKLYAMLPENEQDEISERKAGKAETDNQGETQRPDGRKVLGEYNTNHSRGLHFNGKRPTRYDIALGLLAGFITCIIMIIPAVCMAVAVGDVSLAAIELYLSRYFYLAIAAPILTLVAYWLLYKFMCKQKAWDAFLLTVLCVHIPCLLCGLGWVLSYILLT